MAAGSTYTPIATTTLGSAVSTYTFSSIPSTYTDLVLIVAGTLSSTGTGSVCIRFNGDTSSSYSCTQLDSTPIASYRETNVTYMNIGILSGSNQANSIFNINNYSNSSAYKTILARGNNGADYVRTAVGLWRNTAAITSVSIYNPSANYAIGTTATLYGIQAA